MELTQQVTFWAKSISNPCSRHANTFALNHELDKIECGLLKLHESSKNSALVQKKLDEILHNIKEYRVMSEEKRNHDMVGFGARVEHYCSLL
ncbi:hypothetical protein O1D80_003502 [Vibrio cholerae]|nr:hypothetical protein [Vibrio cholerae]